MGFIQEIKGTIGGAIGGTIADQWLEYYEPMSNISATAGIFPAVKRSSNAGRGTNESGSNNIISNGSKIVVPDNFALITMQDGAITGCIAEPGAYTYTTDNPNAKSVFAGDGFVAPFIKQTWERIKFGGLPASQQLLFYVNLKEISDNKFGADDIYWDDSFLETQVSAKVRGTYTIQIVNPLLFIKNFVPLKYIQPGAEPFDFADLDNEATEQLFTEFIACLGTGFAEFCNDPTKEYRINTIKSDALGLGQSLTKVVESNYNWTSDRGLQIKKVAIGQIEYDENTEELLREVQKQDTDIRAKKKIGKAYAENMQGMAAADIGEAMKNAAANPNGAMMGFMGVNMAQQSMGNAYAGIANMPQQQQQQQQQNQTPPPVEEDPVEKLTKFKRMLDAGLITQEEYDEQKKKILGV
ncbi:MAG: SPFH domain-containing protein [Clostridia bacterium]|nr:SPFH domain-containing protein [Clostridia bacterium]